MSAPNKKLKVLFTQNRVESGGKTAGEEAGAWGATNLAPSLTTLAFESNTNSAGRTDTTIPAFDTFTVFLREGNKLECPSSER